MLAGLGKPHLMAGYPYLLAINRDNEGGSGLQTGQLSHLWVYEVSVVNRIGLYFEWLRVVQRLACVQTMEALSLMLNTF